MKEIQKINGVVSLKRLENMVYCTNCRYCLPCPQGIEIPELIRIWNQYNMIQGNRLFNRDYQMHYATADCCIGCGICEEKCPNGIHISGIMGMVAELFS